MPRLPRRPRRLVPALLLCGLLTAACSGGDGDSSPRAAGTTPSTPAAAPSPSPSPAPPPQQLPGGGRSIFPSRLVVAHYGSVGGPALGLLGRGSPETAARAAVKEAQRYTGLTTRKVLPAMDFIVTVADAAKGDDGDYSAEVADADVQRYLDAARKNGMLLILDFQPGTTDFLTQVKRYEKFLLQPEVGVALDPEWVLEPGQRHLRQVGHTDAATVNRVSSYLAGLTLRNRLPEKLFLLHQFQLQMLRDRDQIVERPGLATVVQADGHGPRTTKLEVYAALAADPPLRMGIKLFPNPPKRDAGLLSPREVLAIEPMPEFVSYQ